MKFKVLKSRSLHLIIISVSFIIFCSWIFLLFSRQLALTLSLLSFPVLLMIVIESGKFRWSYFVDNDGIRINRTFKKYIIPFSSMESVKSITIQHAEKNIYQKQVQNNGNKNGLDSQIELGRLLGFSSVSFSDLKIRNKRNRAKSPNLVLVSKNNGKKYILTPDDPYSFINECRKHGK